MQTETAPCFSDFLHEQVGRNWVLARRTPRIVERYGADAVCLSQQRYRALKDQFERETGCAADGRPGQPCERISMAALELLSACKEALATFNRLAPGIHLDVKDTLRMAIAAAEKLPAAVEQAAAR